MPMTMPFISTGVLLTSIAFMNIRYLHFSLGPCYLCVACYLRYSFNQLSIAFTCLRFFSKQISFGFLSFIKLNDNSTSIEIGIQSSFVLSVFGFIYLICEPGEQVTKKFELFAEELDRCISYDMSNGMQRMYVIFLMNAQRPINIQCYAGIQCTRDTFKQVIQRSNNSMKCCAENAPISDVSGDQQRIFIFCRTPSN